MTIVQVRASTSTSPGDFADGCTQVPFDDIIRQGIVGSKYLCIEAVSCFRNNNYYRIPAHGRCHRDCRKRQKADTYIFFSVRMGMGELASNILDISVDSRETNRLRSGFGVKLWHKVGG